MRSLKRHKGDVREVKWREDIHNQLVSAGNDKTVRLWDISTPTQLQRIQGHADFVRTCDWLDASNGILISGSYDHTVKLWDFRSVDKIARENREQNLLVSTTTMTDVLHKPKLTITHDYPIESVVSLNDDIIVLAGGPLVKIYSLRYLQSSGSSSGNKNEVTKALSTINVHRKTVTCLAMNGKHTRLVTGCLDAYVRVFAFHLNASEQEMCKNTHSFACPSGVLSCDINKNDESIAIGTISNGIIFKTRGELIVNDKRRSKKMGWEDGIEDMDNDIHKWMKTRKEIQRSLVQGPQGPDGTHIRPGSRDWFLRGQKAKRPYIPFSLRESDKIEAISAAMGATTTTLVVTFQEKKD